MGIGETGPAINCVTSKFLALETPSFDMLIENSFFLVIKEMSLLSNTWLSPDSVILFKYLKIVILV